MINQEDLSKSEVFLQSHREPEGFRTFRQDSRLRSFLRVGEGILIGGWTSVHPDVTVAVMAAGHVSPGSPELRHMLAPLFEELRATGHVGAYWWRSRFYTTALLLRSLELPGNPLSVDDFGPIVDIWRKMQLRNGGFGIEGAAGSDIADRFDALSTSLAIESLTYVPGLQSGDLLQASVASLLAHQEDNGSWKGDYVLRIPRPYVARPDFVTDWNRGGPGNAYILDQEGLFATILACFALSRFGISQDSDRA